MPADRKPGFFTDDGGTPSSMRLMSAWSLLVATGLAVAPIFGIGGFCRIPAGGP